MHELQLGLGRKAAVDLKDQLKRNQRKPSPERSLARRWARLSALGWLLLLPHPQFQPKIEFSSPSPKKSKHPAYVCVLLGPSPHSLVSPSAQWSLDKDLTGKVLVTVNLKA